MGAMPSHPEPKIHAHDGMECLVIGAIVMDQRAADVALESLTDSDFNNERNRAIFRGVKAAHARHGNLDEASASAFLESIGVMGHADKYDTLKHSWSRDELAVACGMCCPASVETYVSVLKSMSRKRVRLQEATQALRAAIDGEDDEGFEAERSGPRHVTEWIDEALAVDEPRIRTGYCDLDQALDGGFVPGTLVVEAGKTSDGKSTVALNLLMAMAALNIPVALFTLEDSAKIAALKMISSAMQLTVKEVSSKDATIDKEVRHVRNETFKNLPIQISQTADLDRIKLEVARMVRDGVKFLVIDQLSHITTRAGPTSIYERVSMVTRELQALAIRTDAVIMVLHQVNRTPSNDNEELMIHHLRDSGTIEQNARVVILIKSCERHAFDDSVPAVLTLQIAKNSYGPRYRNFRFLARFACARIDNYFLEDGQ